jgi:hypothetical protein
MYYTSIEDLNLFYEVADAPFGLYWQAPVSVMFDEPWVIRSSGISLGQRFPYTLPVPGAASNKTLPFGQFEPLVYSPGYNIHNKLPYAEHFNLSIQRELTKSTVLTLAYVGTGGHHLIYSDESNAGNPALCQQLNAEGAFDVTNGTSGCGPGNENDVFQLPSATVPCSTKSPTPLPGCVYSTRNRSSAFPYALQTTNNCPNSAVLVCYAQGNTNTLLLANSIYNAGQITVERKANDFTFLAAYTFGKALDNASAFGDSVNFINPKLSRGLSSTDIAQNFVASYIWAIPFDRAFGNAPKRLTQGWQIQGITRFATGFPVQLSQSDFDNSLYGSPGTDFPNRVGPVQKVDPRKVNTACPTYDPTVPGSGTGCYFLPTAFAVSTEPGSFGTANRRFFHGPGFNNTDFGILKRTAINERFSFDLRFEFFNIFNHTQFTNPGGNIHSNAGFGVVTNARAPRIGQVGAKFYW